MKKILICLFAILMISMNAHARTVHIRSDGGPATRCTGTTNAADTGSGSNQPCAYNSMYWVWPHPGNSTTFAAVSGDIVVLHGSADGGTGQYRVGCQGTSDCMSSPTINFTTSSMSCSAGSTWTCGLGVPNDNTTLIGCNASSGCGTNPKPQLWGAGGKSDGGGGNENVVLSVKYTNGTHLSDLDITDHEACDGTIIACTGGVGDLSINGGILQQGANGLVLTNVNVHGLKRHGIWGGIIGAAGIAYHNVHVYGSSLSGIEFSNDCPQDGNTGHGTCGAAQGTPMIFDRVSVKYAGCTEEYPLVHTSGTAASIVDNSCFEQNTGGGYGDGVGNDSTSGNWIITDSEFSYNTSDGFDALYSDRDTYSGANFIIKRNVFEGNVGACFKDSTPPQSFEDNVCIGNTQYFYNNIKATTNFGGGVHGGGFGYNRGNAALQFGYQSGSNKNAPINIINNTIISNFEILIAIQFGVNSPTWTIENNILEGGWSWTGGQKTAIFFYDTSNGGGSPNIVEDYNVCSSVMRSSTLPVPCAGTHDKNEDASSTFTGSVPLGSSATFTTGGSYWFGTGLIANLTLKGGSLALNNANSAVSGADAFDFYSSTRTAVGGGGWDMGALESGTSGGGVSVCGNNITESGETCDGTDLNGSSCISQGFTGGSLSCATNCGSFVTSSCTNTVNFPLTPVLDTFTRANSTGLGANWTNISGSMNISSNVALPQGLNANDRYYWNPASFSADEEVYATINSIGTNHDNLKLYARYVSGSVNYKLVGSIGNSDLELYVDYPGVGSGGDPNELEFAPMVQAFSSGDSIGMSVIGSTIKVYYKANGGSWVLKGTFSDTHITTGGQLLIGSETGGSTPDIKFTNFGGGSLNPVVCGNNIRENTETCDGTDVANQTCSTQGFTGGSLTCNANCGAFVTSGCTTASVCGNNTKETGEVCDGTDISSQTCVGLGYISGTLACSSGCGSYNTSACVTAQSTAVVGGVFIQ